MSMRKIKRSQADGIGKKLRKRRYPDTIGQRNKLRFNYDENENEEYRSLDEELGDYIIGEKSPLSKSYQRRRTKKRYKNRRFEDIPVLGDGISAIKDIIKKSGERFIHVAGSHKKAFFFIFIIAAVLITICTAVSSCSVMAQGSGNLVVQTSYVAEDENILKADEAYSRKEALLREQFTGIESQYPGYDGYIYDMDEVGHDPYELASFLTVKFADYKYDADISGVLEQIFAFQYLTAFQEINDNGKKILKITLRNRGISYAADHYGMSTDEWNRYHLLTSTKGNRGYLFDDIYSQSDGAYDYKIPGEALTDSSFAAIMQEAEKYLGMAYVWGGSSPSTGFDCSGFVSWVINHSGWNMGRQTARTLLAKCTVVSAEDVKPGDLVFFEKTYDVEGASHVGIYVGNGMMIHCGNPISYASINTRYWQQHFLCFARLPGKS